MLAGSLASRGARLLLVARDPARLKAQCERLRSTGSRVEGVCADVATPGGRERIVAAARGVDGGVNVLVNNAGVNHFGSFCDQSDRDARMIFETNAVAPMLLTQQLLPILSVQPRAIVLNLGSILGSVGLPGQVAYSSSKFALHGFSEALRRELQETQIRVLYVAPRSTDTRMNDAKLREINAQMGVATDDTASVADHIVDVLRREHAERFIGWPERLLVKLNALVPSLADRLLEKQARLVADCQSTNDLMLKSEGVKS